MVVYLNEQEMIDRFGDGLKKAASRTDDFLQAAPVNKPRIYADFIEGIKVAAGSAHQLAQTRESPKWLKIRDILELVIVISQELPVAKQDDGPAWKRVKEQLEALHKTGIRLYLSRPEKRQDVLVELAIREQAERAKNDPVPVDG